MKIRSFAAATDTLVSTALVARAMPQTNDSPPQIQCEILDGFLTDQDLYEEDHELFTTTESELEENTHDFGEAVIGDLLGVLPGIELGNTGAAEYTAGLALGCGLVKEDPVFSSSDIFDPLESLSP